MSFHQLRPPNTVTHMKTSMTQLQTSTNGQQLLPKERHSGESKKKSIQKHWKAVLNVVTWAKQVQKVRFIVDPILNGEIDEADLELEHCTVDESVLHYLEPSTKNDVSFCTLERYFWDFVNSNSWTDLIRVTEGELQASIIRTLNSLVNDGTVSSYKSVEYTNSSEAMNGFLRRGTLVGVTKKYEREKRKKKVSCFRFTREYYCHSNPPQQTISMYHPLISKFSSHHESNNAMCNVHFCVQLHTIPEKKQFSEDAIIQSVHSKSPKENPGEADRSLASETSNQNVNTEKDNEATQSRTTPEKQDENYNSLPSEPRKSNLADHTKATETKNPAVFFIPRINQSFKQDTLEGLSKVEFTRESITNSLTWHTIREIVIKRRIK